VGGERSKQRRRRRRRMRWADGKLENGNRFVALNSSIQKEMEQNVYMGGLVDRQLTYGMQYSHLRVSFLNGIRY
jgi:hypothetical protein